MTKGITAQKGLTLLEILIALVVLSVGLLGIAGMQATGLRNNHAAYTKTQATALAMDMADRIRANPKGAAKDADSYTGFDTTGVIPEDPKCIDDGCTPAQMAAFDKYQWSQPLISNDAPLLPGGRGIITRAGDLFTITLLWLEPSYKGVERIDCIDKQPADTACLKMSFQP